MARDYKTNGMYDVVLSFRVTQAQYKLLTKVFPNFSNNTSIILREFIFSIINDFVKSEKRKQQAKSNESSNHLNKQQDEL